MKPYNKRIINQDVKVSVITVNYNQPEVTCDLIESLRNISYKNIEIIVVDNNSEKDIDQIKTRYPEIKLIKSKKNLGFAGGNNLGLKHSKGEYVLFINNDVEVEPDFMEPLLEMQESSISIGAISPKINYYTQKSRIQYAGTEPVSRFTLRNKHIGSGSVDQGQYFRPQETAYAHGACMMVSKRVIDQVGPMDEQFFLYYEEQDWCERIRKLGYMNYVVPKSQVFHKESVSTGKNSPLKTYYLSRNRILFARKNFTAGQLMISFLYMLFVSVPKNTIQFSKNKKLLWAYYRGIIWNLTNKSISYGNH